MVDYYFRTELGQIVLSGQCADHDIELQSFENGILEIGKATVNEQYYENGNLINIPPKPTENYFFDYSIKQWVFNIELGTQAALQKRDQLLADGPDRISPLWWSSMTLEQQQSWTDYRQALLDITSQPEYPQVIIWPTKPE